MKGSGARQEGVERNSREREGEWSESCEKEWKKNSYERGKVETEENGPASAMVALLKEKVREGKGASETEKH